MQCRAQTRQKVQTILAQTRIVGIDLHRFEEAINGATQRRHLAHSTGEVFLLERRTNGGDGLGQRRVQRLVGRFRQLAFIDSGGVGAIVLLLLDLEDVGGTLVTGEEVFAVVGLKKILKSGAPHHKQGKIALAT